MPVPAHPASDKDEDTNENESESENKSEDSGKGKDEGKDDECECSCSCKGTLVRDPPASTRALSLSLRSPAVRVRLFQISIYRFLSSSPLPPSVRVPV